MNPNEVVCVMSTSNEIRRAATSNANHPERKIDVFVNIDSRTNCLQNIGTPSKNIPTDWKIKER